MTLHLATPVAARRRSTGSRTAVVGVAALLCLTLAGCGDPEEDDGGGGGGYVSQESIGQEPG